VLVIPALDLHDGSCIRMHQGDLTTAVVCDDDPVRRARQFVTNGATRLHVVDIDAAFGRGDNLEIISRICRTVDVPVQVGGGVRSIERALQLVKTGASNVVLGTLLAEEEDTAARVVERLRGCAIAGIDARGNRVATRGWQTDPSVDRDTLANRVSNLGISRIIFTEIARDGTQAGFDVDALNQLANATTCRITASGGARSVREAAHLAQIAHPNVDSCIIGRALYGSDPYAASA
jgi:phosphoribosylformimino-5-aminoimidazole carboxamide ribotide isomerase